MSLEKTIQELKPNHFLTLVNMPKGVFDFYCVIMNQGELSFNSYAIHIVDYDYLVSPYELLHAKDSPCERGFMIN